MIAKDFFFMFITRTRVKERHSYHIWSDRVNMQHQIEIRFPQKPAFLWIAMQKDADPGIPKIGDARARLESLNTRKTAR